jgi:ribonuclease HI
MYSTIKDARKKVIGTDSLSTLIAASDKKQTRNPKTQTIRKLIEQEGSKVTLIWVLSHVGFPGNEEADYAAKNLSTKIYKKTEKYLPQDLVNWMTHDK